MTSILSVIGIEASWINADNLSAISANLGGWIITDDAIYKEYKNESDGSIYRLYIQPPDNYYFSENKKSFIEIHQSKDNGATFNKVAYMNDTGMCFTAYDGSSPWLKAQFESTGMFVYNLLSNQSTEIRPTGIATSGGIKADGNVQCADVTSDGLVYGAKVRSGDGQSGSVTLSGIKMAFSGGILTSIGYT